jgi:hypothetical protein
MCPYVSGSDPESPVWIFCYSSLGTSRSVKPGLVAFRPDATLYFTVRAGFLSGTAELATIGLVHLVSYEHMGAAVVRCIAGCSCDDQVIDAHLRDASNGGDFVREVHDRCGVQIMIVPAAEEGRAHLLQSQDVDVALVEPRTHALAKGGAHAVNVHGGEAKSRHGWDSFF